MARYIKFEDVLSALNEVRCSDCYCEKPLDCALCQIGAIHRQILTKTVILDAAPKSEVAREIFAAIKKAIKEEALAYCNMFEKSDVPEFRNPRGRSGCSGQGRS